MNKWSSSRIIIQNSQLVIKINIYLIKFVHGEIWIMEENDHFQRSRTDRPT